LVFEFIKKQEETIDKLKTENDDMLVLFTEFYQHDDTQILINPENENTCS
jgi:hypothetical protein